MKIRNWIQLAELPAQFVLIDEIDYTPKNGTPESPRRYFRVLPVRDGRLSSTLHGLSLPEFGAVTMLEHLEDSIGNVIGIDTEVDQNSGKTYYVFADIMTPFTDIEQRTVEMCRKGAKASPQSISFGKATRPKAAEPAADPEYTTEYSTELPAHDAPQF